MVNKIRLTKRTCKKCGYTWFLRKEKEPQTCAKCRNPNWNKPKKKKKTLK